ncbi:MAG: DUF3883 domain-containing protein [Candidatus Fermentibacter sp.]|nr:DUF3883 domain-containing protein [Candidatus Fermentibacter sp.]
MGTRSDWSEHEVALTIQDYFEMLLAEAEGRPYSKSDHRRSLIEKLDGRSDTSIERKHMNISAVLIGLSIAPIDGYKPLANYQHLLATEVARFIANRPDLISRLQSINDEVPDSIPAPALYPSSLVVDPPELVRAESSVREVSLQYGVKVDFAENDRRNRRLGELGERFVLDLERRKLLDAGRDDLAGRIDWVSSTRGDGLGYDIVSFDCRNDSERFIEVKTTNQGMRAPFYITSNELRVSTDHPDEYRLYRLFRFSKEPRLFILNPPLASRCDLVPKLYRASF